MENNRTKTDRVNEITNMKRTSTVEKAHSDTEQKNKRGLAVRVIWGESSSLRDRNTLLRRNEMEAFGKRQFVNA